MKNPLLLFFITFIVIISTYLSIFGQKETFEIITNEYLSILALFAIITALIYFKIKLKNYEIIEYLPTNNNSLKSAILFFLFFEIIDYFSEDGFIGMIKQWFLYWIMGLIALFLMETINYYKNYKLVKKIKN